ncbi:MAG TPA: hypothetical protein VHT74_14290 [Acetobacteraceae bacterium]|jgi:hypothetical protein|nr:hypothetical protein [Acetobacteraceae bacterium]
MFDVDVQAASTATAPNATTPRNALDRNSVCCIPAVVPAAGVTNALQIALLPGIERPEHPDTVSIPGHFSPFEQTVC